MFLEQFYFEGELQTFFEARGRTDKYTEVSQKLNSGMKRAVAFLLMDIKSKPEWTVEDVVVELTNEERLKTIFHTTKGEVNPYKLLNSNDPTEIKDYAGLFATFLVSKEKETNEQLREAFKSIAKSKDVYSAFANEYTPEELKALGNNVKQFKSTYEKITQEKLKVNISFADENTEVVDTLFVSLIKEAKDIIDELKDLEKEGHKVAGTIKRIQSMHDSFKDVVDKHMLWPKAAKPVKNIEDFTGTYLNEVIAHDAAASKVIVSYKKRLKKIQKMESGLDEVKFKKIINDAVRGFIDTHGHAEINSPGVSDKLDDLAEDILNKNAEVNAFVSMYSKDPHSELKGILAARYSDSRANSGRRKEDADVKVQKATTKAEAKKAERKKKKEEETASHNDLGVFSKIAKTKTKTEQED